MTRAAPKGIPQTEVEKELAADIGSFSDDPFGFVMYVYNWGEGELEGETGPDAWQADILNEITEQIQRDPTAPIRIAVASGHGIGKVQPDSLTDIPTPSGLKTWGELEVGDSLFDAEGRPTKILEKFPHKNWGFYKVTFDDGSYTYCGKEHLWTVKGRKHRRRDLDWETMSLEQIMKAGVKRPNGVSVARQWEIPTQGAVEFPEAPTTVHPYLMGLWLGDGKKGEPKLFSNDPETIARLRGQGYDVTKHAAKFTYYVKGNRRFTTSDVWGCNSYDRYIPDEYKFVSVEKRQELLRGLCDSDADINPSGSVIYNTTSRRLAYDVAWLVRSLGGKASLQPTPKTGKYRRPDTGEEVICRDCYRVTLQIPFNPFTVKHRKVRYRPCQPRYAKRWIESIEYSHTEDGHCVTVDNERSLYQCNDFIVTHNTALAAWLILWRMSTGPQMHGVVTANSKTQLDTKTWAELALWHKRAINKHWFKWTATKFFHVSHPETWFVGAQPNTEHKSESFAGLHSPYNLTLYDEGSAVADKIWEVTEGTMTDDRAMHVVFGNPTRNTGAFRECFRDQAHRWITRQIDSRTAKRTNKKAIAEMIETYGEDSDFCRVRVLGQFPRAGSMQYIPSDIANYCRAYECPFEAYYLMPIVLGVDVARYGEDQTVFVIRQGRKVLEMKRVREWDTMRTVAQAAEYIRHYQPAATFVDGVGIGAGVVDRLRQLGYSIVEVNAGRKPYDEKRYFNKRAEMWARMKEWLMSGADIPDNERELVSELIAIEYGFSDAKTGELLRLERKKDTKEREGFSPDGADALSMTFAEELGEIERNYFEPEDGFEPDYA